MTKAIWNNKVIAEADEKELIEVEGNIYFPPFAVRKEYLKKSDYHTTCPWKGEASYYTIEVDGKTNKDAAWYYPEPSEEAQKLGIKNYVAFWKGVEIEK